MLVLEKIYKNFGNKTAIDNLNLEIKRGEIIALLGQNGAGKSTLLKLITSLQKPTSGNIEYESEFTGNNFLKNTGYLPEERGLILTKSIKDQVLFLGRLKGMNKEEIIKNLKYWMEVLEVKGELKSKIGSLSKGNQQKVQIICALINNPDLIILDEPYSGLDQINGEILTRKILDLKAEGKTIIFSTHRLEDLEYLCDRVLILDSGKLILDAYADDLSNRFGFNVLEIKKRIAKEFFNDYDTMLIKEYGQIVCLDVENIEYDKNELENLILKEENPYYIKRTISISEVFSKLVGREDEPI
jgi:ABC-2 type transport system ATP-binding protein